MPRLHPIVFVVLALTVFPAAAAAEADKTEGRAERPALKTQKLSPTPRAAPPRPDQTEKMRRVAPPRGESPLQHVPALMDPPPGPKAPSNP